MRVRGADNNVARLAITRIVSRACLVGASRAALAVLAKEGHAGLLYILAHLRARVEEMIRARVSISIHLSIQPRALTTPSGELSRALHVCLIMDSKTTSRSALAKTDTSLSTTEN